MSSQSTRFAFKKTHKGFPQCHRRRPPPQQNEFSKTNFKTQGSLYVLNMEFCGRQILQRNTHPLCLKMTSSAGHGFRRAWSSLCSNKWHFSRFSKLILFLDAYSSGKHIRVPSMLSKMTLFRDICFPENTHRPLLM